MLTKQPGDCFENLGTVQKTNNTQKFQLHDLCKCGIFKISWLRLELQAHFLSCKRKNNAVEGLSGEVLFLYKQC